ncbi:MAG: hypothetical protein QXE76_00385 [Candidatus Bathyarchaeia archaeon]
MKINYKKSMKFVILLLSSLLIAVASATVYNYMYMTGTIGVEGMTLEWRPGEDSEDAGTTINGATVTMAHLKGPPNGTRTYSDPVRLKNTGASAVTFDLTIVGVSGDTEQMDSIYVKIYSLNTSALINTLTVWSGGSQGSNLQNLQIPGQNAWRFQWEITWKSTATTSHSVTVSLRLDVPA